MKIINNNPYRQLGVYSTSTQKEVVANQSKMKAFLKVGRQVSFPLDLNGFLPDVLRTEQSVADATSKLSLPTEQLKYAQFWFSKNTQLDEIACRKLTNGDIDGANDVIQNAFNRLYCSQSKVSLVDKKQHFNTLVSRFEVFLKKVFYLKNHSEIVSTKPGQEGLKATLADCIYQTPCLKRLKFSESEADKKFSDYLGMVRDWRNDNAHKAPTATEQECDTAINVLTSMYLYVVAFGIKKREIEVLNSVAYEDSPSNEAYLMAAEPSVDEQ